MRTDQKIVVLVGGVGGAKLAYGLSCIVPPENLTVIVNVADDFWHYGLRICPDSDTIMYTLSGLVDKNNGWGVADDTTRMLESLKRYGEDAWFRLGDRDLATHVLRTHMLREGRRLTDVTRHLTRKLGIQCDVLPVSDDPIATMVDTMEEGELEFQQYFVRHRWQPTVKNIRFDGIEAARLTPEVEAAVCSADVILFGPSNPWLSIEPVVNVPGMRELLTARELPRVAITPIIRGDAVKGPAAKIMRELEYEVSAAAVARFYNTLINGFVLDDEELSPPNLRMLMTNTLMRSDEDKINLAHHVLAWVESWNK